MVGLLILAIGMVVVVLWSRLDNARLNIEQLTRRIDELERQKPPVPSTSPRPQPAAVSVRVDQPAPVEASGPATARHHPRASVEDLHS